MTMTTGNTPAATGGVAQRASGAGECAHTDPRNAQAYEQMPKATAGAMGKAEKPT